MIGRIGEWLGSGDVAIDLGTANTLIYVRGKGVVLDEPSVAVVPQNGQGILAIGREAKAMYGRTPERLRAIRPLKDGVIADFDIANQMIQHFLGLAVKRSPFWKPTMLVAVPSGITQVEKKAVVDAAQQAGAKKVHLMEEPMAAALGAKLPVHEAKGNMIVDIGGGTTEIAVISMLATAYSTSIRVAGDEMDEAIQAYVRERFQVLIGLYESERVKLEIGSSVALKEPEEITVRGRDLVRGVPSTVTLTDAMVRDALREPIEHIVKSIRQALDQTPPELASDILDQGIVLAGGGSMIRGLGPRLHQETQLRIFRAKDPLKAVVYGAGEVLESLREFQRVLIN